MSSKKDNSNLSHITSDGPGRSGPVIEESTQKLLEYIRLSQTDALLPQDTEKPQQTADNITDTPTRSKRATSWNDWRDQKPRLHIYPYINDTPAGDEGQTASGNISVEWSPQDNLRHKVGIHYDMFTPERIIAGKLDDNGILQAKFGPKAVELEERFFYDIQFRLEILKFIDEHYDYDQGGLQVIPTAETKDFFSFVAAAKYSFAQQKQVANKNWWSTVDSSIELGILSRSLGNHIQDWIHDGLGERVPKFLWTDAPDEMFAKATAKFGAAWTPDDRLRLGASANTHLGTHDVGFGYTIDAKVLLVDTDKHRLVVRGHLTHSANHTKRFGDGRSFRHVQPAAGMRWDVKPVNLSFVAEFSYDDFSLDEMPNGSSFALPLFNIEWSFGKNK